MMLSVFRNKLNVSGTTRDSRRFNETLSSNAFSVIDASLQRKFSRGVQYNLKIVIRGDRNVGKTCLFNRLQGKPFVESYSPTERIQAASIHWNYKATDDVIKVDVWDVVDKVKTKRKPRTDLKLCNETVEIEEPSLDAEFIDVYKNAHGVLLVFDVTKLWTWEYVKKEISSIPSHLPVLILANRIDMNHHRQVRREQASYYTECLDRGSDAAKTVYAECSMRNGFGLKLIYLFFNVPFLHLQKETLLKQLETNVKETALSIEEIEFFVDSDENNYDMFIENLDHKRRQDAEKVSSSKPKTDFQSITTKVHNSANNQNRLDFCKKDEENREIRNSKIENINVAITKVDSPLKVCRSTISSSSVFENTKIKHNLTTTAIPNVDEFVPVDNLDTVDSFYDDHLVYSDHPKRPTVLRIESESDDEPTSNVVVLKDEQDLDTSDDDYAPVKLPLSFARSDQLETPVAYKLPLPHFDHSVLSNDEKFLDCSGNIPTDPDCIYKNSSAAYCTDFESVHRQNDTIDVDCLERSYKNPPISADETCMKSEASFKTFLTHSDISTPVLNDKAGCAKNVSIQQQVIIDEDDDNFPNPLVLAHDFSDISDNELQNDKQQSIYALQDDTISGFQTTVVKSQKLDASISKPKKQSKRKKNKTDQQAGVSSKCKSETKSSSNADNLLVGITKSELDSFYEEI